MSPDDDLDFDDMIGPADGDAAVNRNPTMGFVVRAPAVNSVEFALREVELLDPILHREMLFTEEGQPEAKPLPDDPEIAAVRPGIVADYQRHIALARSMGPSGTWTEYHQGCRRNGMTPIYHSDDKGDSNE